MRLRNQRPWFFIFEVLEISGYSNFLFVISHPEKIEDLRKISNETDTKTIVIVANKSTYQLRKEFFKLLPTL